MATATPRVVVETSGAAKQPAVSLSRSTWSLLWWIGLFLLGAGLVDLSLAFYPAFLDSGTWRFAAFSAAAFGLPLPGVGVLSATMAALASERRGKVSFALVLDVAALISVLVIVAAFASGIGPSFDAAEPGAQLGLKKVVFKTFLFSGAFAGAFATSAFVVAAWLRNTK